MGLQGTVEFPNASALYVTFDRACTLPIKIGDVPATLTLSLDREHTQVIAKLHGGPEVFKPIIVPAGRVFYKLDGTRRARMPFVVKFAVTKLEGMWLQEFTMFRSPSPQWSLWVFEFLIHEQELGKYATRRGIVHNNTVVTALFNYLRTPQLAFKQKVLGTLTRILSSPHLFSLVDSPQLERLLKVTREEVQAAKAALATVDFYPGGFLVRAWAWWEGLSFAWHGLLVDASWLNGACVFPCPVAATV